MKKSLSSPWYKPQKAMIAGMVIGALLVGLFWAVSANLQLNTFKSIKGVKSLKTTEIQSTSTQLMDTNPEY